MTGSLSQTRGRPEPGRELDALIAEKVMGRTLPTIEQMRAEAERVWKEQPGCRVFLMGFEVIDKSEWQVFRYLLPDYSTDLTAAFTVVEKMVALGHNVSVMCDSDGSIMCEMATPAWRGSEVESARTVPLAICLAALAALSPADDGGAR